MNDDVRWRLCLVGMTKLAISAVLFLCGTALCVHDPDSTTAALALFGLAGAVGVGGHALCQSCCWPKGEGPPSQPKDGPR